MSAAISVPESSYGTFARGSSSLLRKAAGGDAWKARLRRIKEAERDDPLEAVVALVVALHSQVLEVVVIVLKLLLFVPMVAIGFGYLPDCPLEPVLPLLLLGGGIIMIVTVLLSLCAQNGSSLGVAEEETYGTFETSAIFCLTFALNTVLLGSFIIACFLVYPNLNPSSTRGEDSYCHPVAFQFAFWLLNFLWACLAVILLCFVGTIFYVFCILP